ncbi:hypothetical protein GCM10010458_05930 [Microbacterium luteolum]
MYARPDTRWSVAQIPSDTLVNTGRLSSAVPSGTSSGSAGTVESGVGEASADGGATESGPGVQAERRSSPEARARTEAAFRGAAETGRRSTC